MSMTSQQRVLAAIEHRRPDRVPLNYYGTAPTDRKLMDHLQLGDRESLLRHLGADMRYVAPRYVGPSCYSGMHGYHSGGTDMWSMSWRAVPNPYTTYYELIDHPLCDAQTVSDIESYTWPDIDWLSVDHIPAAVAEFNRDEPRAIVCAAFEFIEIACGLRGTEQFLMDMVTAPEMVHALMARVTHLCRTALTRAVETADGAIDIVWSGSDVGMQTGMLFGPAQWRDLIKPYHRQLIEPFKGRGLKTRYHSDGSIEPIIEDLIGMGLDLLDPIQPNTPGMDPENLAARFGGRIAFYGGVDTQGLLPYGTPQQIEQYVLHLIDTLGPGYIAAASNAVQADAPVENILALYRTAREYRYIPQETAKPC